MKAMLFFTVLLLSVFHLGATPRFQEPTDHDQVSIAFGKKSKIVYNNHKGTYDVYIGTEKMIAAAFSEARNNGTVLRSTDYQQISFEQVSMSDQFGAGKKYTFRRQKKGLPEMVQVFWVYRALPYFFTEVIIKGDALKSNYMSPLTSNKVNLLAKGDNRNLFVPFDNDTFIRYESKSMGSMMDNTSAEVGAFYENKTRKGLIVGSVEHTVWKTGVRSAGTQDQLSKLTVWGGYSDKDVTRDKIEHGALLGSSVKSPKVFVGYFEDWRVGLEDYGKANRLAEPPFVFNWTKPVPFGWNSWGVIQEKLTYEKAVQVVDFFSEKLPEFKNGETAYIDLDSFWDNFTGGMSGDYSKLKQFAAYCKSKGLQPGVYWAPFTDWGFKSNNDRKAEGSEYKFSEMWTRVGNGYHDFDGARALDPTHPGTLRRIDYIIDKLNACGFKMIKIDFLGHAAAESTHFFDPSVTTGMQAYKAGMEYLVKRLNGQMLIYAAISPSLATGRYAHTRRIACDAWKTIKDTEYTLNSVTYGWWQTYIYNFIDADHVVFSTESKGANKARLTSALITGTLIMGDDFSAKGVWQETASRLLRNKGLLEVARSGKSFRPLDGNTSNGAAEVFFRKGVGCVYIAVLNYGLQGKHFSVPLNALGLKDLSYNGTELFSEMSITLKQNLQVDLPAADAAIYKINTTKK